MPHTFNLGTRKTEAKVYFEVQEQPCQQWFQARQSEPVERNEENHPWCCEWGSFWVCLWCYVSVCEHACVKGVWMYVCDGIWGSICVCNYLCLCMCVCLDITYLGVWLCVCLWLCDSEYIHVGIVTVSVSMNFGMCVYVCIQIWELICKCDSVLYVCLWVCMSVSWNVELYV